MKRNLTLTSLAILCLLAAAGLPGLSAEEKPGTAPARAELKFQVLDVPYPYHALQPLERECRFVLIMQVKLPATAVASLQRDLPGLLSRIPDKQLPPEEVRDLLREGRVIRYLSVTFPQGARAPGRLEYRRDVGMEPEYTSVRPGVSPTPSAGGPPRPAIGSDRYLPGRREPTSVRPGAAYPAPTGYYRPGAVGAPAMLRGGSYVPPAPAPEGKAVCEIALLARTVEQAEQLARGLIAAYDLGWAEHERQNLLAAIEQNKQQLAQLQPRLEETEALRKTLHEKVEKFADIPEKTIDELKTKGWLLDVELEGVRARITAAEKLLKQLAKTGTSPESYRQVELMTMVAQIDMAGLLGQKQCVRNLLEEAEGRKAACQELLKHDQRFGGIRGQKESLEQTITTQQDLLASDLFKSLEVVGNRATIQPVRWPEEPPRDR